MKRKLITEEFTKVNTSIIKESKFPDWYFDEVEATFQAYGLDEVEIDLILNDPDVMAEIMDAKANGFGPEKTALYLLQQADEKGLVPNENPAPPRQGVMGDDIDECGDEHPAGDWQGQEADRRWQRDHREYDPDEEEYPYDDMDESARPINEVSLGDMYREMGTWMRLDPKMQRIADESGLTDENSEDLQYLVNGWMDGQYDEDPEVLMSELENIIEQL